MPLSPNVKRAFDDWIKTDTWCTGHSSDQHQFYKFVWAVREYSRKRPSEMDLEREIINQWTGRWNQKYLEHCARKYAGLYVTLLEFADSRRRR